MPERPGLGFGRWLRGDPECTDCGGSGTFERESDCRACRGSGLFRGKHECRACAGTGTYHTTQTCRRCKGSGRVKENDTWKFKGHGDPDKKYGRYGNRR